jgi:hypothetical protein
MKKTKVLLTAFTVLAIVGSALAFKANRGVAYCYASVPAGGACLATTPCVNTITSGQTNMGPIECIAVKTQPNCTSQFCPTKSILGIE